MKKSALGVGAFSSAIFHLTTHAFFKALLFLSAGALIYVLHHEQNIQKNGRLKKKNTSNMAAFFYRSLVSGGAAFGFWFF